MKQRLDAFIVRYEAVNLAGKEREDALKELDGISEARAKIRKGSIPLTPHAYKDADAQIASEQRMP